MRVETPCINADSTALTDLYRLRLYGQRCGRADTAFFGYLDARGRECDTLYFDLTVDSLGTTYDLWAIAEDTSGNLSPGASHFGLAVPARDFEPGLLGAYYNRMDWTQFCGSRIDGPIAFDWGSGGPIPCITPYDYSVEWTGKLRASVEGIYTLWLDVTSGAQLKVNGAALIDRLTDETTWTQGWPQFLAAGSENAIELRYVFNWQGGARITLSWTPPGGTKATIPLDALEH